MQSKLLIQTIVLSFVVFTGILSMTPSEVSAASNLPSCRAFEAAQTTIHSGQKTVLAWKTLEGTHVVIDHGVLDTRDDAKVKEGTVFVSPTKDTTFKLTVYNGSDKDSCVATIKVLPAIPVVVSSGITTVSTRSQTPSVSTIAVTRIPYTGFDGSSLLSIFFFGLLGVWVSAAVYVLFIAKGSLFGFSLSSLSRLRAKNRISLIPHDEYAQKLQSVRMQSSVTDTASMKTFLHLVSREKIKYGGIAIALIALSVFVVLPLLPQVNSSLTHVGFVAKVSNADDTTNDTGADMGDGVDAGNGDETSTGADTLGSDTGSACCTAPGFGDGVDAGNGDDSNDTSTNNPSSDQGVLDPHIDSTPVDLCLNIIGDQSTVPAGMIIDAAGQCVTPPPTDLCPNIIGSQSSVPAGMIIDAAGNCVTPPVLPLSGTITATPGACVSPTERAVVISWTSQNAQFSVPQALGGKYGAGQHLTAQTSATAGVVSDNLSTGAYSFSIAGYNGSVWSILHGIALNVDASACAVTPPDLCPNIPGNQATIPPGMIVNAAGECVLSPSIPSCDSFVATPNTLANPGNVTLTWATTNIDSVSIDNGIGAVAEDGSVTKAVSADTTFILTATKGAESRTCQVFVDLTTSTSSSLSCDAFSIAPTSVEKGATATMTWNTSNADSVSIDNGVGTVSADGSRDVTVDADKTFILTAVRGSETKTCNANVSVITHGGGGGGGGGGSLSPTCLFDVASSTGTSTTLHWTTHYGTSVTIDHGVLATTTSSSLVKEGSITINPAGNTKYQLTVARGSSKRVCTVDLGGVTAVSTRDQQPLTSISFSNIPYTGFEAGPMLTSLFYILLTLWSLGIAYVLVIKGGTVFGFALPRRTGVGSGALMPSMAHAPTHYAEPEAVHDVLPTIATAHDDVPFNLPVAPLGTAFGAATVVASHTPEADAQDLVSKLEVLAHGHNVLLSSDALRMIIDHAHTEEASVEMLTDIMNRAKATYAREDGWVILNRERVMALFAGAPQWSTVSVQPTVVASPIENSSLGAHTLAEALLTQNTTAAYSFLGEDALEVIADAAEALDSIVRARAGNVFAPDMLLRAAQGVTDIKIKAAIGALVTAIDGTYADQTAAVRLAVIKALKALSTHA